MRINPIKSTISKEEAAGIQAEALPLPADDKRAPGAGYSIIGKETFWKRFDPKKKDELSAAFEETLRNIYDSRPDTIQQPSAAEAAALNLLFGKEDLFAGIAPVGMGTPGFIFDSNQMDQLRMGINPDSAGRALAASPKKAAS